MASKKIRNLAFSLHRYIGLVVGLILIVIGLTGSILVFQKEIDHFWLSLQIEQIVPQANRLSIESLLDSVKQAYSDRPNLVIDSINMQAKPDEPYQVWLQLIEDQWTQVLVNPYTGKILGTRQWEHTFIGFIFQLHYQLLAGDTGMIIAGITALLLLILSITGLILWPGWRRLISGFKIKWQAHPKRINFDIHKVTGVIASVFLVMISFTGFCWNFHSFTYPIIYAVTLSPQPKDNLVSQVIPGQSPLGIEKILQKADAALPNSVTTWISLPSKPDGVYRIDKKFPQEITENGKSHVYLDRYTGDVLQVQNALKPTLGDGIINSFTPMHYGTFGGLPTRILYLFIGLSPTILFITGFVMWRLRYKAWDREVKLLNQKIEIAIADRDFSPFSQWPWF